MKLTKTNVEHVVADVLVHGLNTACVAKQFKISQRRVQQLVQYTKKNGRTDRYLGAVARGLMRGRRSPSYHKRRSTGN